MNQTKQKKKIKTIVHVSFGIGGVSIFIGAISQSLNLKGCY